MFEDRIGKEVKVVFKDTSWNHKTNSSEIVNKTLFGIMLSSSNQFIDLRLGDGTLYAVKISEVVSIKTIGENNGGR